MITSPNTRRDADRAERAVAHGVGDDRAAAGEDEHVRREAFGYSPAQEVGTRHSGATLSIDRSSASIDTYRLMSADLQLTPKRKRAAGERCCEPVVYPDVERAHATRMAEVAKALGDPIRLQLVDVLRRHAGEVCVCELVPLFDIAQPTLSHHLAKLRAAGIVDSERRGLWAYYYVRPEALLELSAWLSGPTERTSAPPSAR